MKGKVVLVTGASQGIGLATVQLFAREGASVVLADLSEAGRQVAEAIRSAGGDVLFVKTDVSDAASVEALFALIDETHGRLDCAVNNAGIDIETDLTGEWDEGRLERTLAVNVAGVFLCMKHEIRRMQRQGGGAIVNLGSVAGLVGAPFRPAYVASKHGVIGLTRAAAIQYGPDRIRVNAVCPGGTRTPLLEKVMDDNPALRGHIAASNPLGRLAEPGEIAEAILWLASDKASYVTGQALAVDGGYVAG